MRTLAFLTDRVRPHGTPDDRLVVEPLAALGVAVRFVPWEDAEPDPSVAAWIVRSPWNYARQSAAFLERLAALTPLVNDLELVRWNANKHYLSELAEAGVSIIPTVFCPREALPEMIEATGWDEVVVKPAVSAGGENTRRILAELAMETGSTDGLAPGEYLVQPFLSDVLHDGELSAVYFNGVYSHAVRKRPKSGNFLVHEEFGGSVEPTLASPEVQVACEEVLRACPSEPLYARLDWIESPRGPLLVEAELIEPELFLRASRHAPGRFAEVLAELAR